MQPVIIHMAPFMLLKTCCLTDYFICNITFKDKSVPRIFSFLGFYQWNLGVCFRTIFECWVYFMYMLTAVQFRSLGIPI